MTKKKGFVLFYTVIFLMVISILIMAVNGIVRVGSASVYEFMEQDQKLLIDYSLKKIGTKLQTSITLVNGLGKSFKVSAEK
ncbi:MAG: hypothetical protein PHV30_05535 [Candidatus Margulisbacteria bacterium]|nr:hypothetical protein [Candidatus Margulisiibacteriota bacterium]